MIGYSTIDSLSKTFGLYSPTLKRLILRVMMKMLVMVYEDRTRVENYEESEKSGEGERELRG